MEKILKVYLTILLSFIAGWLFMPGIMDKYKSSYDKKQILSFAAIALILLFMFVYFAVGPD